MEPIQLSLNIAGEQVDVLFDGRRVSLPLFPEIEIDGFTAQCGTKITQDMLVEICRNKVASSHG